MSKMEEIRYRLEAALGITNNEVEQDLLQYLMDIEYLLGEVVSLKKCDACERNAVDRVCRLHRY
jgi:hypothetical protein